MGSKIFIIKRDHYIMLDEENITYQNNKYPITNRSKNGSTTLYKSKAGILEVSNSLKKLSRWNGISIMLRDDIEILPVNKEKPEIKRRKKPKNLNGGNPGNGNPGNGNPGNGNPGNGNPGNGNPGNGNPGNGTPGSGKGRRQRI